MLQGAEAVEGSVGVGLSTGVTLSALFLEVELSLGDVMNDSSSHGRAAAAGGGSGTVATGCDLGGGRSSTCTVDARGETTIELEFSDCASSLESGRRRNRDGRVQLRVLDPAVCLSGVLRERIPFRIEFDGFRSTISDAGRTVARFAADLTENVILSGDGCLASDGTRDVAGSLTLEDADAGVDFSLQTTGLRLAVESASSPCRQTILADGAMDVDDRANALRFSQRLDAVTVTLMQEDGATLVGLDGAVDNDCLGEVRFATPAPILLSALGECPLGGSFAVGAENGADGLLRFLADGGLTIDLGPDGIADKSVPTCRDDSLAQCAR
jgi:hypothetical protein